MTSSVLLPTLTALASALVGGVVALLAVYFANRGHAERLARQLDHELDLKRRERLLERGEELYELVDAWLNALFGHYISRAAVMQGKLSYNEALDLDIKAGDSRKGNYARIQMLIDVYFPDLREAHAQVLRNRETVNDHVIRYKRAYERGDLDGSALLKPFTQDQLALEASAEALKSALIEQIRAA